MNLYFPIIVTVLLTFPQVYFVKKGKILYALLLSIFFSISIITYINQYDLYVYALLGNTLFYLMVFAAFITRPRFKTKDIES